MNTHQRRLIKNRLLTAVRSLRSVEDGLRECSESALAEGVLEIRRRLSSAAGRLELRIAETRDKRGAQKGICAGCGFPHNADYKDCVWLKNPY